MDRAWMHENETMKNNKIWIYIASKHLIYGDVSLQKEKYTIRKRKQFIQQKVLIKKEDKNI